MAGFAGAFFIGLTGLAGAFLTGLAGAFLLGLAGFAGAFFASFFAGAFFASFFAGAFFAGAMAEKGSPFFLKFRTLRALNFIPSSRFDMA